MTSRRSHCVFFLAAVALVRCSTEGAQIDIAPEGATGRRSLGPKTVRTAAVVAAHPIAAEAGRRILEQGGSAIDAAVAVQAVLTFVEPQSSGIGGGAFLMHHSPESGLEAYDGRETAPAGIDDQLFIGADQKPLQFFDAVVGGRSVGVPGALRMLALAHQEHGKLPWKDLFGYAIEVAKNGVEMPRRLRLLLQAEPSLRAMSDAKDLFYPGGRARTQTLRNLELSQTFALIASEGPDVLYTGRLAQAVVEAVKNARQPTAWTRDLNRSLLSRGYTWGTGGMFTQEAPGFLSAKDLADYRPIKRKPLCIDYSEKYRVCGHPPPTSGGVTTLQILGLLSRKGIEKYDPFSVQAAHLLVEAGKLAFADRAKYIGDPDFVDVPVEALLSDEYLDDRASLISLDGVQEKVKAGTVGDKAARFIPDISPSLPSTSHFCIFDGRGGAVSMTTSIENVFGSRLMVKGFLLNNQLTDFAFVPKVKGQLVANAPAPKKRPRSSMSPLMAFDRSDNQPVFAIGSAGGSRIIGHVAHKTVAVLSWGLDPQSALNLPHVQGRSGLADLENEGWPDGKLETVRAGLQKLGHEVRVGINNSGTHAALKVGAGEFAVGVDPRREGEGVGLSKASTPPKAP